MKGCLGRESDSFSLPKNKFFLDATFPKAFAVLRTFAPIVSAHPYCARKFTCHVMHERALSHKINMIGQMAIARALPGFNDLGCTVTQIFLLIDHFLY